MFNQQFTGFWKLMNIGATCWCLGVVVVKEAP